MNSAVGLRRPDRVIALDVGMRHTGVAFADRLNGVPLPLETVHHKNIQQLVQAICTVVIEKDVGTVVLGLPLLPSGTEGPQAQFVRGVGRSLSQACTSITVLFLDERHTNQKRKSGDGGDPHEHAAMNILSVMLARLEKEA